LIYLDSSVALAQLFGEGRSPPEALWQEPLVSSRLLEYGIACMPAGLARRSALRRERWSGVCG